MSDKQPPTKNTRSELPDSQLKPMEFFKDSKPPALTSDGRIPETFEDQLDARLHARRDKFDQILDPVQRDKTKEAVRKVMVEYHENRQTNMKGFDKWNAAETKWIDARPAENPIVRERELERWRLEQQHHGFIGKSILDETEEINNIMRQAMPETKETRRAKFMERFRSNRERKHNVVPGRERER